MSDRLKANELNAKLFDLYKGQWKNLEKIHNANPQLSHPHLVYVPDSYTEAKFRLMIVGKQTNGWSLVNPIEKIDGLRKMYKNFTSEEKGNNTLFWKAARRLNESLNYNPPRDGFLWSNLIKMDYKNDRPKPDVEQELCGLRLLQEEIKITRPNVVVFFTGPTYDERLKRDFIGVEFEVEKSYKDGEFAKLKHELLPANSFRTYHPGYRRWKRRSEVIDKIADLVKKSI